MLDNKFMKHYSEQDIATIKENIKHNIIKLTDSVKWVETNLKYEEKNNLLLGKLITFRGKY